MVRVDVPAGFTGDPKNKFIPADRTDSENLAFNYVSKLANFRKTSSALEYGALMQFIPSHGVYTYFRYDQKQTILCTLNSDTVSATFNFNDFSERTRGFDMAVDVMTGATYPMQDKMNIPARSITILELKKR